MQEPSANIEPGAQPSAGGGAIRSLRWSLAGASALFLLDVLLFIPGIGMLLALVRAVIAAGSTLAKLMVRPADAGRPALVMLIYVAALAAILLGMRVQEQVGLDNAAPLIAAIDRYHHETGEYPPSLDRLQPHYLDTLPVSSYRLTANEYHFQHDDDGTYLYFYLAPPTIYKEYDFRTRRWLGQRRD